MELSGSRFKVWPLAITLLLLLPAGCSKRQASIKPGDTAPSATAGQKEAPQVVLSREPEFVVRQHEKELELLVSDVRLLREKARDLQRTGHAAEGRRFLEEALNLLLNSQLEPAAHPTLETAYDELLAEIRRLDVLAAMTPQEAPFPLADEVADSLSPLDEIASLDLYAVTVDPRLEDLVDADLKQTPFDFPIVVNQEVLKFLDYYQDRGRKATEAALRRSGRYVGEFRKIFAEEGLPQDLVYMAHVESLFKTTAYSRARARGIWQFMSGTARLYGLHVGWWLDERLDVEKSAHVAARYLKDLHDEFGDWYLVLAAYNVGKGRVSRVLRRHGEMDYWQMVKRRLLPRETRNFVPSILAAMIIYRSPERYGFTVEPDAPLEYETVPVGFQADLRVIADALGIDNDVLTELNPELLRGITPADSTDFQLKVPFGLGAVGERLAAIPPEKRLRWTHHKVRSGETLSHIAGRYGVSIRAISEINHIRNINRLSLGQDLVIPLSDWRAAIDSGGGGSASGSHIVRRGDSLYKIARHYGVRLRDLFRWNHLRPGDLIHPGQEILVTADDTAGN